MPDTVFVINPAAASGKMRGIIPAVRDAIAAEIGGEHAFCFSDAPGHAESLAREALSAGARRIISVGGDGTHHEVLNGFWRGDESVNPDAVFGILPFGTGNDLAKSLGMPHGLAALKVIRGGKHTHADVARLDCAGLDGKALRRYFINTCHIGIGGVIADRANRLFKKFGKPAFLLATLATIPGYRAGDLCVQVNGEEWRGETLELIIANGKWDGGGMRVAPHALLDDGLLEVYTIRPLSPLEAVLNLHKVYRGELTSRPDLVRYARAQKITIPGGGGLLINVDGETAGRTPAEIILLPGAIRLLHGGGEGIC